MSGKNSIQVAIKVRPLLKREKDQQSLWRVVNNSIQQADSQTDPYYFDHIFDQEASNQIIFEKMAKHIVHSAIQGFNGTIFAYGQTSSGKTYTMMGDDDNPGVMVLAAKDIFREIELATDRQFLLRVGYIEIYNEKIYDLLNKKNQDLKIHETPNGIITVNCEECIITCEDELLHHLTQGSKERTVGETNMNERSSRSHAIFRIIIESRRMDRGDDDAIIQSVLNLVDLAGSERADQTGARGTRLKEGGHINKSLLFLSNVIKRLSENEDHKYISYRDSKLTRILQASLGGNALTAIICTIKPTAIEETQSTLSFALRAKSIKNKPQVNETVSDATMMKRLEREIKVLRTRLEEEQRKNESQIKVRQLEQRIRDEDLKIISCNSLHSVRNREKRRRTWCPSSTNLDTSSGHFPSALPLPSFLVPPSHSGLHPTSRLQPPKSSFALTPLITMRPTEPQTAPRLISGGLPTPKENIAEIDEEFAPSEMVNFERLSPLLTPKSNFIPRCSITPKVNANPKLILEKVENDLLELKSFTNLESKIKVQYDPDLALQQTVNALTHRIAVLENERIEYIQGKHEVTTTREHLYDYEKRCDALQIQVSKLTTSNKAANDKIAKYELELAELKKTNEKLEMENRDAVNLEFEFERHKNKSKLREKELIEVLKDKEKEITKLEKSLKSVTEDKFINSKQELLQLSLTETNVDENGKVCVKCEDLQRLLADNEKVTQEFAKLTLEYEQLRLNYREIEKENEQSKLKINELEELQKTEHVKCEKLQEELKALREKLQDIQSEYEHVNLTNSAKTEECMALNRQVELARQEMVVLQEKYNKLELSWQEQQQTLKDIESQYADIETKYKHLQSEYEQLESCKGQSVTDCERLQKENVELQTEIVELKHKVQDVHQQLLENAEKTHENISAATAKERETTNVHKQNEQLKQELSELQTQFDDLQKEYDDLSNQLMDNLQESETLKLQNTKLEERVKAFEERNVEVSKAEAEMCELKSQLEKVLTTERKSLLYTPSPIHQCRNSSMRSSGVCIEEEEFVEESPGSEDLLKKFCQLSESLTQIELEHQNGKRRVFKTPTTSQTPNYKLYLRNILGVTKIQKDFVEEMENIHLQGSFKQHSFHIVELGSESGMESEMMQCNKSETNGCANCVDFIAKLKEQVSQLQLLNEEERQSNKSLLENTERNLCEMREQITQLSAELLEKSMFVENCACKTYQRQIETLEKEKADITLVFEELQEKVTNCTFDGSLMMNFTLNGDTKPPTNDLRQDLDLEQSAEREMLDTLDSQTKMLEDMTQRNLDLESDLKSAQEQLDIQEKEYKEKCNHLQLEILERLEMSANEHRDNMKKYNKEWETGKDAYEATIKELESQMETLKEENENARENTREIQEQLERLKNEFNQLQSEHLELQNLRDNEETSSETSKELEHIKQSLEALQAQHLQLQEQHKESDEAVLKENENVRQTQEQLEKLKEEYNQLQSELQQTLQNLKDKEETCNETSNELEQLTQSFEALQAQHLHLQEQRKEHEEALKEIENDREIARQTQEQLEKVQEEYNKVQSELQQTLQNRKVNEETSSETTKELQQLKQNFEELQAQHLQLQEQHKEHENARHTEEQLETDKDVYTQLQSELQQALENLKNNEANSSEMSKELEQLKQNFEALQTQLQEQRDEHEEALKEKDNVTENALEQLEKIKEEYNQLQSELQQTLEILKEYEATSTGTSQELEQLKQNSAALQTQLEEQRNEHEQALKEKEIATDNARLTQEQLEKVKEEYNQLQTELQKTLESLKDNEATSTETNKQLEQLQENFDALKAQYLQLQDQAKYHEELLKDLDLLKEKEALLLKEKEEVDADLLSLRENFKKLNEKHNSLVQEKHRFSEEKGKLHNKLSVLEEQLNSNEELQERMEKLEEEKEQLIQERQQILHKLQGAEMQIQEYCNEDLVREEMIKTLQAKIASLEALEVEKENLCRNLEQVQSEKSDLNSRLEVLTEERQNLEKRISDFIERDEAQQKLSEMKLQNLGQEKQVLEDQMKQFEMLQEQKALLEEQLKTLETIVEENKALEDKLRDHDTLQQAHQMLEEQLNSIHKERNDLQQISVTQQEQLRTLENIKEEKSSLEEQLKEFDVVKQERDALEEQHKLNEEKLKMLAILQQESKSLDEKLHQEEEEKEKQRTEISALNEKVSAQHEELQRTMNILEDFKERETTHLKKNNSLQEAITALTNSSSILELEKCNLEKQLQQCNAELQQLRNEQATLENQLTQLTEEKKSLSEEKATLKEQLKCLKEKEKVEELLEQMITEKSELSQNLRLTNEKLEAKQHELDTVHEESEQSKQNLEQLKCSLVNFKRENERLESELVQYHQLSEEKSKLEATIADLKNEQAEALSLVKQESGSLQLTLTKYERKISLYKQNEETLCHKVEKLSQELHELRSKAKAYETLLQEHEEVGRSLNAATKQNEKLSNEIKNLQSSISATAQIHEETVQTQTTKIQELGSQLLQTKHAEQDLCTRLSEIQDNLQSQQSSLKRQTQELTSSLGELQLKCDSLQAKNGQLQTLNQQLEQQLQQAGEQLQKSKSVQDELSTIKAEYADLQRKMEATVDEAGRSSRALREDLQHHKQLLESQLETYNTLRTELTTKERSFEEEKEQLTSTIATLQGTTATLEEKIRELTINNFKQDLERQTTETSANTSLDGNSSVSPRPRRSIESMNISIEDKLCANQQKSSLQTNERKNRRLSTFDERRRQSYWGVAHDKQTMTDPVDTSCNCVELDRKLKECESSLFIRESQVTALSMELRNHPLKDENVTLMKRLQEEQDKNRIEIKRYKQKIYEQTLKAEKALAAIAQAENKSTAPPTTTTPTADSASSTDSVNAETQTEGDVSASLSTLQGKYNDLINICRHRKTVIKELQERVAHKENADGNSMSALEVGQMRILKSQCESMKKELKLLKEKYDNAKIVLHTRREEIQRLRSQLEQS